MPEEELRTSGRVESCWRARVVAERERERTKEEDWWIGLVGGGGVADGGWRKAQVEGSVVVAVRERSVNPGSISARRPTNPTSTPDSLPPPADLPDLPD